MAIEIVGCIRRGVEDMLWCDECEFVPHSDGCVERRRELCNGYVIQ